MTSRVLAVEVGATQLSFAHAERGGAGPTAGVPL
jgi:hypothetical protein